MISIIIPNYNGENLLKKNLPYVFKACDFYKKKSNDTYEIIVVDDGSKDSSVEFLKKEAVKLIINRRNLGFSSTVNLGVKEAQGEIVVLLNTDVRPNLEFLIPLIESLNSQMVGAVGCMDKSIENGKTVLRGRGVGKWDRGFLYHRRGEVDSSKTLWVSGGSSAFNKKIWDKVGGLNEVYNPFYWEDIDLSYRIQKSGYKVLFNNESIVVHEHEKGTIKSHYTESKVKEIAYRNQFFFVWLNATDLSIILSHWIWLPIHIINSLRRHDKEFIKGLWSAFILSPKIIQLYFRNRKLFSLSDSEVIKNLE